VTSEGRAFAAESLCVLLRPVCPPPIVRPEAIAGRKRLNERIPRNPRRKLILWSAGARGRSAPRREQSGFGGQSHFKDGGASQTGKHTKQSGAFKRRMPSRPDRGEPEEEEENQHERKQLSIGQGLERTLRSCPK
jgi:hypothetical protein